MEPITVDKEKLTVTLNKREFSFEDTKMFRMYGFTWSPDGVVVIPVRGTAKKAIWHTIKVCFPSLKKWENYQKVVDDLKDVFNIFERGFDKVVTEKVPLYGFLFEHQRECVRAQCYKKNNLLALEQGLGKSMAALIPSMILNTELTLIIVPNSLKYNWKEEMVTTWQERFGYGVDANEISIIDAKKGYMKGSKEKYIIINYDILEKYYELIIQKNPKRIIIDECHYIKNRLAKKTKTIKNLVFKLRPYVSLLSGTPAKNKINDMFSYLEIARHYEGDSYKYFLNKYCFFKASKFGMNITGAKNLDELSVNLSNFMIRKTKQECLDLPEKSYIKINFENDEYDELYNQVYMELMKRILNSGGRRSADIESQMSTLQILTSKAKVKPCIELCENLMEEEVITKEGKSYPKKVAIMCNFKEPLYMLQDYFKEKCVLIDGSVSSEHRMDLVNAFKKQDDVQVFLGQTTAAGVGLNMTECHDVIFLNFPYTRAEIDQASDRFHRIGTTEQVSVYFTVLVGKIDEYIYKIVQKKYKDVSKLIDRKEDNTDTVDVGDEFIGDLFNQMRAEISLKVA